LILRKTTRSILDEISNIVPDHDRNFVIESRATHIINSAINLLKMINESYDGDDASELERRLINSIRNKDPNKFIRGLRRIRNEDQ
jgi:hypothetical protein